MQYVDKLFLTFKLVTQGAYIFADIKFMIRFVLS